jgi:hypothetical protein
MTDLRQVTGRGGSPVDFAITVIHLGGHRELLADHSGVLKFSTRDHAERMIHRLAFDNNGDLYEVTELPK